MCGLVLVCVWGCGCVCVCVCARALGAWAGPWPVAENGPERLFLCGGYEAAGGGPGPWRKMAPNGHFYVVAVKRPAGGGPGPWRKMA